MYVCICNAVTDTRIRAMARRGVDSIEELCALTGCSGTCGQCVEHAEEILAQALAEQSLPILSMTAGPRIDTQPAA